MNYIDNKAIQRWHKLGPLNIEKMIEDNNLQISDVFPTHDDKYFGQIENGERHGIGRLTCLSIYEGQYRKGIRYGFGRLIYHSGSYYIGEVRGIHKHGKGTYYSSSEEKFYSGLWI